MILERAEISVDPQRADEVVELLRSKGLELAASYTGCLSFKALRCVEYPDRIMFLAEWESIEAHHLSRHEPAHIEFRELLLPFATGAQETVHFAQI